ncbi:MAG TPA: aminotransferase class V-fold PLP-dependent enzyme [Gemmatimonadaceae bacterium]|nr:aminotransferase class V-fold PLP-dependent enzyme [Gemmatimonadaceae bacterium]
MSYDVDALRRDEFPWATAGETIYLNNASTGPMPERSVRATAEWAHLRANPERVPYDLQFGTLARGRELIARLVGAETGEIALATNTTFGINLAAFSLPLATGDVVLTPDLEFPANVYPWMQLAERRGVEYRRLECDDGVLDRDRLERELEDERVRVVSVSWVQANSGARADLTALGTLCRERGVYFVVDAIQGLGPLEVDLRVTPVDILTSGAQKWMLGPWGAGFVYVRKELVPQLEPHDVSWMAVRGSDDFTHLTDYDLTWREDARRYEFITLPYQDFAGMNASLELIHELGPEAVSAHSLRLADMIVSWACSKDVPLVTPTGGDRRAAIVLLDLPDAASVSRRLKEAHVAHSLRKGGIRLSPYFFNTEDEIGRVLRLIEP